MRLHNSLTMMIVLKIQKLWGSEVEVKTNESWQGTSIYNLRYNYYNLVRPLLLSFFDLNNNAWHLAY